MNTHPDSLVATGGLTEVVCWAKPYACTHSSLAPMPPCVYMQATALPNFLLAGTPRPPPGTVVCKRTLKPVHKVAEAFLVPDTNPRKRRTCPRTIRQIQMRTDRDRRAQREGGKRGRRDEWKVGEGGRGRERLNMSRCIARVFRAMAHNTTAPGSELARRRFTEVAFRERERLGEHVGGGRTLRTPTRSSSPRPP